MAAPEAYPRTFFSFSYRGTTDVVAFAFHIPIAFSALSSTSPALMFAFAKASNIICLPTSHWRGDPRRAPRLCSPSPRRVVAFVYQLRNGAAIFSQRVLAGIFAIARYWYLPTEYAHNNAAMYPPTQDSPGQQKCARFQGRAKATACL
jgi:hypothetical protein